MKRRLIAVTAVCLVLAVTTDGAARQGRMELDILGGWTTQSGAGTRTTVWEEWAGFDTDSPPPLFRGGATGADLKGWFVMGGIGWFLGDDFQIGPAGFGAWMDGSASGRRPAGGALEPAEIVYAVDIDASVWGVGGRAKWHFSSEGRLTPYVGAQAFWARANISAKGTATLAEGTEQPFPPAPVDESHNVSGLLWGPIVGLRHSVGRRADLFVEYQFHLWSGSLGNVLKNGHAISGGLNIRLK